MPALSWAHKIHQQLLAYSAVPIAPWLMVLAYPRFLFLWRETREERNPDPDAACDLGDLLHGFSQPGEPLDHFAMETAVAAWFKALSVQPDAAGSAREVFECFGIFPAIAGGFVMMQAAESNLRSSLQSRVA
jgi:hypothetical protein